MPTIASMTARIRREGRPGTLRRVVTSGPDVDVAVSAIVHGAQPVFLVGAVQQSGRVAVFGNSEIAAAGWPGPPRDNDRLIMADGASYTIQGGVDSRYFRGAIAFHVASLDG